MRLTTCLARESFIPSKLLSRLSPRTAKTQPNKEESARLMLPSVCGERQDSPAPVKTRSPSFMRLAGDATAVLARIPSFRLALSSTKEARE